MAKKWAEVAASDAFKALTPDQQDGARRQYFDQVVAPQVPDEHVEQAWNQFSSDVGVGRRALPDGVGMSTAGAGRGTGSDPRRLDTPRTERTWGEAASDTVKSLGQGLIDVGGVLPGVAYGAVTGDYDNTLLNTARGMNDIIDEGKSDVLKARQRGLQDKLAMAEGWREKLAVGGVETLSDPTLLSDTLARSAPSMLAGGVVGRAAGAGTELLGNAAIRSASTVASPMATAGLKVAQAAPAVASGTAVGSAAAIQGSSAASDTYDAAMKLPIGDFRAQDGFSELAAKVGEDKAKSMFATEAANRAGLVGAAVSLASMKLIPGGDTIEKALLPKAMHGAETAVERGAGSVFTRPMTKGMAGGLGTKAAELTVKGGVTAAEEGLSEGMEEGGGAVAKALETSRIEGSTPDLGETFGEAAGQAIPVGMLMGHAAGAHEAAQSRPDFATREQQIKSLREGGDTAAADLLQQKHERMTAEESVDGELAKLPGNEAFAQNYREMRFNGTKPAEAAARSAVTVTFGGLAQATGIPEKATAAALEKAKGMPLEKIPGFLHKFASSLAQKGLIEANDGLAQVGPSLEAARDEAMDAAVKSVYVPVQQAMADVLSLEGGAANSEHAVPQNAPSVTEIPAPVSANGEVVSPGAEVDFAAHDAATSPLNNLPEPTDAQKAAGNYKVGRVNLHGLNISIENPEGSVRRGTSLDGAKWENELRAHYGYIRGTEGNDGDHVDAFIGPNPESQKVFVVDQVNQDGSFDEHKVMLGTDSLQQADQLYHANYHDGWTGRGAITEMSMDQFKAWVKDGKKTEPVGTLPNPKADQTPASAGVSTSGDEATSTPAYFGRDSVPLAEGGKAFKTRKSADDERKLNPMMRVVRAEGGYALTEKTPAQLAAQEKSAKRLRNPQTSPAGEPIPAHAMIASAGGLAGSLRADMGMQGNVQIGNRKLFAGDGKGLSIEQATEKLVEDGYLPNGASHDDARNLIKRSLTKPQYTAQGTERQAEAEMDARRQAYEEAVAEIEDTSDNQFAEIDVGIPLGTDSNVSEAEAMRAMGFSEQEIEEYATSTRPGIAGQDSHGGSRIDAGTADGAQADHGQRTLPQSEDQGGRSDTRRQESPVNQTPSAEGVSVSGDANEFIKAPDGSLDFGEITPEMSKEMRRQAGKIRLTQGVQNADGTGYGLVHIEARHGREIRAAGFDSVQSFLVNAFQNMDEIWKPGKTTQLIAVQSGRTGKVVFIQLEISSDHGADYYRINSAFPVNEKYVERKEKKEGWVPLWNKYPVPIDASGASGFAGQSPSAGETTPTVSPQSGAASVPTPAPESKFTVERRADGTLAVKGDAAAIREALKDIPGRSLAQMRDGILVGRTQADKAMDILQPGELTAPTKEDVLAQQARADKAAKGKAAAERAAEKKAAEDEDRKRIAKASEAVADTFELGGDAMANLTGQSSMFSRGAQTDSVAFKKWFGDSKVVDADGKPMVMYHGTRKSEGGESFTAFDTYASNYGLMGQGGYFTADPEVASSYTSKGKGTTPTVYPAYLSIKNPIDMDAKADPAAWQKQFDGIEDYHEEGDTNESWYRAAEEVITDQEVPMYEGAEIMQDGLRAMGFDGITHIGGGRIKADGVKHRVYVAFDPEQIKSAIGNNGQFDPANPDIRYALGADAFRIGLTPRRFMPVSEVQKAVDQLSAKWQDGPAIKVVQSAEDLPVDAPGDARGLIHKGTAYIVAANHLDRAGVARTLAHEAIGHYGLWKMLGDDGRRQFERNIKLALASGNKPLKAISAKVRELYVDESGKFNLTPEEEANEIAAFAVEDALDAEGNFKPGFGFLKQVWAKVADFLRGLGFEIRFTNAELQGMLVSAMRGLESGRRLDGGMDGLVAAARDADTDVATTLLDLGQNDDLFMYPRSDSLELQHIAEDKGGIIEVSDVDRNSDKNEVWMLANTTPKDNVEAGTKSWMLSTPQGKLATLTRKGNDVYINVSGIGEGNGGSAIYDLAANYALNNGLVFVGDPNGVSSAAMRRRLENMLSSAIKYGTTDHIKPHDDQYLGNDSIGIPPLDWTIGDTLSNIRHMVDVSIASTKFLFPNYSDHVRFDPATQSFVDAKGRGLDAASVAGILADRGRTRGLGEAGRTTVQRAALYDALVQSQGARRALLGSLRRQPANGGSRLGEGLKRTFYARGVTTGLFAPTVWNTPEPTRTDRIIYELQDGRVDLKRVQQAIEKSGQQIKEQWDARLAESLYPGRVAYRSQQFLDTEVKTLLSSMANYKVPMDELADYLHARGAEERNAQVAKVNPDLPDGGAGRNSKGVLMTNDAARDYLAAVTPVRKQVLDALAKKVDAITAGTRRLLVAEGLEKQETIDAWESAYKNYVPMFRDEAQSGSPHPQGTGFAVKGSASKRATGSTKEVTNILAHVLMQREAAITRAEKNRVALALYGQALSHPNPEFWTTIKPSMKAADISAELVKMGVDPATAAAGMELVPTITTVDQNTGKKVDRPNPMYKSMPGAITLKVHGEDRVLMLNVENERGARMAESLKNLDGLTKLDLAGSIVGKATRWMASVNTQFNPAFGLVNATRDSLEAMLNLGSTPLAGQQRKLAMNMPAAMAGIYQSLRGKPSGKWAQLYEQFQADGAQTGFKEMFRTVQERTEAVDKMLANQGRSALHPSKVAHAALDVLDGFNTIGENVARLAAYKLALDNGLSRPEAARLARELTIDFNRKGRMGRELGPLYAFFNASVQGTARMVETLSDPKRAAKIIGGGLALGALQAMALLLAGYDDDEPSEWVKSNGFVVPLAKNADGGQKRYFVIPYPAGFKMIPNSGRILTELALTNGKDVSKKVGNAIGSIASTFNPFGGGDVTTLHGMATTVAPTVADPVIDLIANKNFAGNSIEREARGEADTRPGASRVKEQTQRSATGQVYLELSKAINAATGGNDYEAGKLSPTPERLRYIAQTVGGGVLREIEKAVNASVAASHGDPVKMSQIPAAGRFYGEIDDAQVKQSRYFESAKQLDSLDNTRKAIIKAGDSEALDRLYKDHPEAALIDLGNKVQSNVAKLNKLAVSTITDPTAMKEIDAARVETMDLLNQAMKELEQQNKPATPAEKIRGWKRELMTQ